MLVGRYEKDINFINPFSDGEDRVIGTRGYRDSGGAHFGGIKSGGT
jgi:hypothetical protein